MGTKPNKVEEVQVVEDERKPTVVNAPATTFDERTKIQTPAEQLAEKE